MTKRSFWLIQVEDGLEPLFHDVVPYGHLTEKAVVQLLARLVSKHCLSDEEIISASVSRSFKRRWTERFRVRRQGGPYDDGMRLTISMGDGPTASATIFTEDELRSRGLWKEA